LECGLDAVLGDVSRRRGLTRYGLALAAWASSWRVAVLAGPAARALVRDDPSTVQELAAPHTGELLALDRDGEAGQPNRAGAAQHLGPVDVSGRIGEPQLGVV
jgi:hypothetical protein